MTVTTTTTTPPLLPEINVAKYVGTAANTAVAEVHGLGYYVSVKNYRTKANLYLITATGPLPESLNTWMVSSVEAIRNQASATVWVKSANPTPAEQVDDVVHEAGLATAVSSTYKTASAWVLSACKSMASPSQYTTASELLQVQIGDNAQKLEIFKIGIPLLCTEHQGALDDVIEGNVPFGSGTYEIGTGKGQIKPGRYRTTRTVDDCYWERTRTDGEIIDNNFATHAQSITVTVAPTDGSFTSQRCGSWQLVR